MVFGIYLIFLMEFCADITLSVYIFVLFFVSSSELTTVLSELILDKVFYLACLEF